MQQFIRVREDKLLALSSIIEVEYDEHYTAYLLNGKLSWARPWMQDMQTGDILEELSIPVLTIWFDYGDSKDYFKLKGDAAVSTWAYLLTLQSSFVSDWGVRYERYIVKPSE